MQISTLVNSKPPEHYNQAPEGSGNAYWQCLRQRKAWLLQRWLANGGEPFYYFFELGTPVYILNAQELEVLFNEDDYVVRYAAGTYWIIWESEKFYLVFNADNFDGGLMNYTFPHDYDHAYLANIRQATTKFLTMLHEKKDVGSIVRDYGGIAIDTWACTASICCEFEKDGGLLFCDYRKNYQFSCESIIEWSVSQTTGSLHP